MELLNLTPVSAQVCLVEVNFRAVSNEWTMARNDLGIGARHSKNPVAGRNDPIDVAVTVHIDERIKPVEVGVTHVKHVSILEVKNDIAVGVGGAYMEGPNGLTIPVKSHFVIECDDGYRSRRRGWDRRVEDLHELLRRQPNPGIVVGYDSKKQLNQILKFKQLKSNLLTPNLNIKNRKLIDPRKWQS